MDNISTGGSYGPDNDTSKAAPQKEKAPGRGRNKIVPVVGVIVAIVLIVFLGNTIYTTFFQPVWTEQLPFMNSTGQYQSVVFYRNATDPTYANLTRFLAGEGPGLEAAIYNDTSYKCVEYAVLLHDAAEEQGINCSVIGTGISGGVPGHALVEFSTKDNGTVYADPTSMNVSASDFDNINMSDIIFMRGYWKQRFPVVDAVNRSVQVVEYRNASPVSFAQLTDFLRRDTTELLTYDYPNYTCADFATALFDHAEAQGIKCGIVAVQFYNLTDGHAFNAFPTTDKGIVYIDDTGINASEKAEGYTANDNVVYLQAGSQLGELPLGQVNGSLDYAFYTGRETDIQAYTGEWQQYESDYQNFSVDEASYNDAVNANDQYYASYETDCDNYNAAVAQYNAHPDPADLAQLEAWKSRLDQEYQNYSNTFSSLESTRTSLNSRLQALQATYNSLMNSPERSWISYYPIGNVSDYEVYW